MLRTLRPLLRAAAVGLAALVWLGAIGSPAGAIDNGEWAVFPTSEGDITTRSSFVLEIEPGQSIPDSVTIRNLTPDPITFRLYPADAFNPDTGGIAVESANEALDGAGSWISLSTGQVEVPGRTADSVFDATVPFTVTVPSDAAPGDHAAGIAALNVDTEVEEGGENVEVGVQRAVAVPLFIRVKGPLTPSLALSGISVDHDNPLLPVGERSTQLTVTVTNDGNMRLSPEIAAKLEAFGPGGGTFDPASIDNLLPGSSQTITLELDSSPYLGPATVRIVAQADGVAIARSTSFWTIPWLLVVVVVALALFVAWRRRRTRQHPRRPVSEEQRVPVSEVA
ncbi:MAG TPA: DUF916 domain-containing protein [Acidimicrobiales bacterium]